MIVFNIKCKTQEEMFKLREQMHLGLVGSPAYINSEIAVCDFTDDDTAFMLIVGNGNKDDVEYDLKSDQILQR